MAAPTILLKLCAAAFLVVITQSAAKENNKNGSAELIISDEEAAAKCDWDISFILDPKTKTEICNVYCIMLYNGHDFPNEDGVFPAKEEQFRHCVAWSNVAGYPGICSRVHAFMRCVILQKYGRQEDYDVKKTAFIPMIKQLLDQE